VNKVTLLWQCRATEDTERELALVQMTMTQLSFLCFSETFRIIVTQSSIETSSLTKRGLTVGLISTVVRKQLTLFLAQQLLTSYSSKPAATFRSPEALLTLPNLDFEQVMM